MMYFKKKTALDGSNIESGVERKSTIVETAHSSEQYNTAQEEKQVILPLLSPGEENAVSTAELQKKTGLNSRAIRLQVASEREQGALILSCQAGYFTPSSGEKGRSEMACFIQTIRSKGLSTLRAARSARRALRQLDGQICMKERAHGEKERRE